MMPGFHAEVGLGGSRYSGWPVRVGSRTSSSGMWNGVYHSDKAPETVWLRAGSFASRVSSDITLRNAGWQKTKNLAVGLLQKEEMIG